MWLIKWVELNLMYEYIPKIRVARTKDEAKEIESFLLVEKKEQETEEFISELFEGKICSDIFMEEIQVPEAEKMSNDTSFLVD